MSSNFDTTSTSQFLLAKRPISLNKSSRILINSEKSIDSPDVQFPDIKNLSLFINSNNNNNRGTSRNRTGHAVLMREPSIEIDEKVKRYEHQKQQSSKNELDKHELQHKLVKAAFR